MDQSCGCESHPGRHRSARYRPQVVGETRRAERGVESLFGGSKRTGRSNYLQRWPGQRAQKRLREKIRDRTGRNRCPADIRETIAEINPILRGWGTYFRTGNAAIVFNKLDGYVVSRLRGLVVKRYGRNLAAGRSRAWTRPWLEDLGLHRLRGTVRYPEAA